MPKKDKPRRVKKRGVMNKLEKSYSEFLTSRPDVVSWKYEPVKLKLRGRRWFLPDYEVVFEDGRHEFHECKANHRWYEKGIIKLNWAADMYPQFRFVLIKKVKGGWEEEII